MVVVSFKDTDSINLILIKNNIEPLAWCHTMKSSLSSYKHIKIMTCCHFAEFTWSSYRDKEGKLKLARKVCLSIYSHFGGVGVGGCGRSRMGTHTFFIFGIRMRFSAV